ncbi:MAG: hypothetical protein K6G73_12575 [Marinilabiliaceae bacterium]|nr:hypothetical protein [Marinilabiliaceae bacterium]
MAEENQIVQVSSAEMLQAIDRAEIDVQIATAKAYPRDIAKVLNTIRTYAEIDVETAQECFYSLSRAGSTIEGVSVRFAEIVANAWGNLRVATRIIGNDGKTITAQGVCHDLESNVATSVEVKRRITNKEGRTFSEDMQVVTGNAASAIAFRNAVMKVVPKAITKKITDEVKSVAMGSTKDIESRRKSMLDYVKKFNITEEQVLFYCGVKTVENIDNQMLFDLRGAINAINEGSSTVEEEFITPMKEAQKKAIAEKQADSAKEKADAAMAKTVKAEK